MRNASRTRAHGALAALLLSALAGCRVGPNYVPPQVTAPPAFSDDGHNGDWKQAAPADAKARGAWWSVYGDPTLDQLEAQCDAANQTLAAALHAYEAAHALVGVSRSALSPQAGVGAGATRSRISAYKPLHSPAQPADYWDFLVPVSISWEPDFWGGIRRQVESSAESAQASAADLASTRLSLEGAVLVTYLQVRGLDLQASLLRSAVKSYEDALRLTEARRRGGLASDSDVEQARAQLAETRAQLVDLGSARAALEHGIAVLTGQPATGFHLAEAPLSSTPPSIPTGVPSQLLERRPDIAAAERRVAAANAQIGVTQAAFYPAITLGAGAGIESSVISTLMNPASALWSAGAQAAETVVDGGRRRSQVQFAYAQREREVALYREQVLGAIRDVEDQLSTLRTLESEAREQEVAVTAARRSTELSTIRYRRGLAAYLEVITNQTIELTDERAAASVETRRMIASAQLLVALGGGWDATKLPPN